MDDTQLTIEDLDMIKSIINLASTRGAFQAGELTQVGAVYDKLTTFLTTVIAQAQSQSNPTTTDITQQAKGE